MEIKIIIQSVKQKVGALKGLNKIDKCLASLTKRKRRIKLIKLEMRKGIL
jgi:hypothetical protein